MAAKLIVVAVMCAMWCAAQGMDIKPLTPYTYATVTDEGVTRREYCLWEGQKMLLGSRWTSLDCYKCQCTTWKKTCERENSRVDPGCMRIWDEDCNELIVRRDDLYRDCSTGLITGK